MIGAPHGKIAPAYGSLILLWVRQLWELALLELSLL